VGDKDREPFQLSFNGFLKIDFQGSRVTSDGGLLLVRELDERLGLGKLTPGRPSAKPLVRFKSFRYQAASWSKPRRIVAKVEHHPGEPFPRVGFLVTNLVLPSRSVVCFYNKSGTTEQWIKEGSRPQTGLGCRAIASEQTRCGYNSPFWPTT